MNPVSAPRAMWLLARLRLQRLWNIGIGFRFKGKNSKSRKATPGKQRVGWLITSLVGLAMLFSVVNLSAQSLEHMQCYLASTSCVLESDESGRRMANFDSAASALQLAPFEPAVARAVSMQLSLLFLLSILLPLSTREMAQADWDLEWLITLPVKRGTLLWGRILERTLANPTGWIFLAPTCATIAWYSGYRWAAPLIGVAAALALLPLAAMARTLADTGLRMWLPPSQLRNLQAVSAMSSMPLMYLAIGFSAMSPQSPVLSIARAFPDWAGWGPPGIVMRAINSATVAGAAGWGVLLLLQMAVVLPIGMRVLRYQLRNGVAASGAREAARSPAKPAAPRPQWLARLLPSSPIKRRELRLLSRDRNFMLQSLLLPVIIVGSQLLFTGSPDALAEMGDSPRFVAGMAFGIGTYMLMLSAFQTINNEGHSLWMLYTFPQPLESVLREKAEFWAVLALLYPVLMFGTALWFAPHAALQLAELFVVVLAGIPIFSVIAVALGVFACNPLAEDARTRVRPGFVYLYVLLSGLYVYAISADAWSHKLVLIVLMAALGLAMSQKARDQLPYLLDPSAAPPARVSTADGLIAAMLFFVLQGAAFLVLVKGARLAEHEALTLAFAISGIAVYAIMRLVFRLTRARGVPAMLGGPLAPALSWGVAGGVLTALAGVAYLQLMQAWGLFPQAPDGQGSGIALPWLVALAVLAAPLCEEFIFRGLIFGGLRRSMGLFPSVLASAALFAIVHPPLSMATVFVLGACCALVYERTRSLLAPVLVHALYNAALLYVQLG